MIIIANNGQDIASTTYWDSDSASVGLFYLSWNAGAGRLLIPDCQKGTIAEMLTGKQVVISRGPWPAQKKDDAIELMFDDGTDTPFALHLSVDMCSQMPPDSYSFMKFPVTLWTRDGLVGKLPGKYRRATEIPLLLPWSETHVKVVVTLA